MVYLLSDDPSAWPAPAYLSKAVVPSNNPASSAALMLQHVHTGILKWLKGSKRISFTQPHYPKSVGSALL